MFSTAHNHKPIMKGDQPMAFKSKNYIFRKSYHYLDHETALELACIIEYTSAEIKDRESQSVDPLEYDSREISLFELPKDVAKKVVSDKKYRIEFPISCSKVKELRNESNLFNIGVEKLEE